MPIKPENRSRYPQDWKEIRSAILARAGHRCEKCKAPNSAMICRGEDDDSGTYLTEDALVFDAQTGEQLGQCRMSDYSGRMVKVVLTIAHLDHTPEHNDPSNLRAWCQKCHLAYDHHHHQANAQATRRARLCTPELF